MKVLIIEDDAEIAEFISLAFEVGWPGAKLITCHHGTQGIEMIEKESPDVVILDLGLPDIDGIEVIREVRAFSDVPIIIGTVRGTEADIVKGLERGADEYLVKPFGQLELLARVKAILRRQHGREDTSIICGQLHFDSLANLFRFGASTIRVTRTEGYILRELMRNPNHIVTYDQLANAIWGDFYPNAPEALRVYIRRIRAKIEKEQQGAELIRTSPGVGYILEIPPSP